MIPQSPHSPNWMKYVLLLAGVYNVLWGALNILFPTMIFTAIGMEFPRYPELWQCIAMIIGTYGAGYFIAATAPYRHWPIVLVGLLGKLAGPVGFSWALLNGTLPGLFGLTIITNDLIWWIPFSRILYQAYVHHRPS